MYWIIFFLPVLFPFICDILDLRIIDSMVEYSGDCPCETSGDLMKVPQGEVGFIQLSIYENIVDDLLYKTPYPGGRRVGQDL